MLLYIIVEIKIKQKLRNVPCGDLFVVVGLEGYVEKNSSIIQRNKINKYNKNE